MALKRFSKYKEEIDSGFSSIPSNEGNRLLNKNGSFNIQKNGIKFFNRFSLYHSLLNMGWTRFFIYLFTGYLIANLLFAICYYFIGTEHLQGAIGSTPYEKFLSAFFFSTQTLTTVGYGTISPTGTMTNLVAAFESFTGLLGFAMATGLLYGRFSKPKAKIIFSENALISPYQNGKGLMIRVANSRDSQLINMRAKILFSQVDANAKRLFYTLDLEINEISLLASSWTIVHPITEESPLMDEQDLVGRNVEIILLLEGFDETYSQVVHARTSFKANEVKLNCKFVPILGHNEEGRATVSLDEISKYQQL